MKYKRGRLIDHVHITVADLDRSRAFYAAVFDCLGIDGLQAEEHFFYCDELFVSRGEPSRVHLAFQAESREMVDRFHAVALAHGGTDNGAPGARDYHPGYYGAFVLDPDGHNIEAVHHGPVRRSAEAVVVTPEG
ncbi:VOC family protein [Limimaricola pyoseonensis]|uniref:Lactoylglutathione lyase n=1 Tax=Limimaricola pyoseonensis TaxID=521013 RepID=A0A1G7ARI8_9RHOB|nr:VOC family protein [Limimaricola pyoseonensis]SDE16536.1 lactoylglutathione lyase [Limimaricola pyoseonensis]